MAAVALRKMSGAVQAKLSFGLGIQVPGGLARPLVLAFLLASATVSSGKGGVGAGDGEGPCAGWDTGRARERALPSVPSRRRCLEGAVSTDPRRESVRSEGVQGAEVSKGPEK